MAALSPDPLRPALTNHWPTRPRHRSAQSAELLLPRWAAVQVAASADELPGPPRGVRTLIWQWFCRKAEGTLVDFLDSTDWSQIRRGLSIPRSLYRADIALKLVLSYLDRKSIISSTHRPPTAAAIPGTVASLSPRTTSPISQCQTPHPGSCSRTNPWQGCTLVPST